ncbi:MAG: hypothetical protein IT330_16460 [Anaerolineae bacterium]|nr:hypothetical protein [Anaerolineae bacterium]
MAGLTSFFKAIKWLWDHGDQFVPLLETLPQILHAAGEGMELAGQGAINASRLLKGGGGVPANARQAVESAADAVDSCYEQVLLVKGFIKSAGDEIDKVKVPTVEPTFVNVLGNQVVSGLTFGSSSLFGLVADALQDGATKLNLAAQQLQTQATQLHDLSDTLNDAGTDLGTLGTRLKQSGQTLQQVTGG